MLTKVKQVVADATTSQSQFQGVTTVVTSQPVPVKKKKKEKKMSTTTTTATPANTSIVSDEDAIRKECDQLKNLVHALQQQLAYTEQQGTSQKQQAVTETAKIAELMTQLNAKMEGVNTRLSEIDKMVAEAQTELEALPTPTASSGGSWDGTNWVAPMLIGTAITAAAAAGVWYFVLRD